MTKPLTIDTFSGEKLRGAIASLVSGTTAGVLMVAGTNVFGMSVPLSATLFLYIFGSLFGYSLDIVFAKQKFPFGKDGMLIDLPYSQYQKRVHYLLRSFFKKQFFRFIITLIIDTLVGIALLRAAIRYMDTHNILTNFKHRDIIAAILIAIFTFFLYINILRFDWAYSDVENSVMNMLVLMWSTIVMMLFAITYVSSDAKMEQPPPRSSVAAEIGQKLVTKQEH